MELTALALLALALAAPPSAWPGDTEKPTPRQKARQLLDSAAEMTAATTPDVQAAALLHLARNYQDFDRKKSIEFFKQSFTAATTPPVGQTPFARNTQMEIVVALVTLDTGEGLALLKQIPPVTDGGYDYRSFAASRVIGELLKKDAIGQAIDLAEYMGSTGAYPFAGVSQIMAKLPPGDNQLAAVFTSALNAYVVPDRSFHGLLMRYQKQLPAGMAQAALSKIVAAILAPRDNETYASQTLSSSKGTATFTVRENAELFDVAPLIREIDPKRYEELLANRTELRSAMELFPGGGPSVADGRGASIYSVSGGKSGSAEEQRARDAMNTRMQTAALINARSEAALQGVDAEPVLQKITDPGQNVLARIAMAQALLERPFDRLQTFGGRQRAPQVSK